MACCKETGIVSGLSEEPKPSTTWLSIGSLASNLLCFDCCVFYINYSLYLEVSLYSACLHLMMPYSSFRYLIICDFLQKPSLETPYTPHRVVKYLCLSFSQSPPSWNLTLYFNSLSSPTKLNVSWEYKSCFVQYSNHCISNAKHILFAQEISLKEWIN